MMIRAIFVSLIIMMRICPVRLNCATDSYILGICVNVRTVAHVANDFRLILFLSLDVQCSVYMDKSGLFFD